MSERRITASKRRQAEAKANIKRNPDAGKVYAKEYARASKTITNPAADALKNTYAKGKVASTPATKAAKRVNRMYSPSPQQRTRSK